MEDKENYVILDLPLSKQGNSLAVVVPKRCINACNLNGGDFVRVLLKKKEVEELT